MWSIGTPRLVIFLQMGMAILLRTLGTHLHSEGLGSQETVVRCISKVLERWWKQVEEEGDLERNNKAVASAPFSLYLYFKGTVASN